jgi:hypothetical protein
VWQRPALCGACKEGVFNSFCLLRVVFSAGFMGFPGQICHKTPEVGIFRSITFSNTSYGLNLPTLDISMHLMVAEVLFFTVLNCYQMQTMPILSICT